MSGGNAKIVLCFTLSSIADPKQFQPKYPLRILHREQVQVKGTLQYQLVDSTVLNGQKAPDAATKTICAETTSLSPFVVAEALDFAPPVIADSSISPNPAALGVPVTLTATITDADTGNTAIAPAEYSLDNGVTWTEIAGEYYFSSSVNVAATLQLPVGVYPVCLRAADAAQNTIQTCPGFLAVYDPNGGFVTGGGWITSPAGAYTAQPALADKATFGFVSKYQPGASTPSGNTQFQFQAANFSFKSKAYEWLVVAGARAQFKGSGTLNGAGDYAFLLTAMDGEVPGGGAWDKFRIKIWDRSTGQTVYDNQMDADDSADPTTMLGGGSIIIHKP